MGKPMPPPLFYAVAAKVEVGGQESCTAEPWFWLPQVTTFQELLLLRVGFAAAQATQNPICFSLIPELFPRERTTAMAAYNSAIYMGRALSFAAVIIAGQLGVTHSTAESVGVQLVHAIPSFLLPFLDIST